QLRTGGVDGTAPPFSGAAGRDRVPAVEERKGQGIEIGPRGVGREVWSERDRRRRGAVVGPPRFGRLRGRLVVIAGRAVGAAPDRFERRLGGSRLAEGLGRTGLARVAAAVTRPSLALVATAPAVAGAAV